MLVVCPLQTISDDQVAEARNIGMSAASVADVSDEELRSAKFQLLFGSAEKIINHSSPFFFDGRKRFSEETHSHDSP